MKALTIRQPWCWAILAAGKRIENRSWQTHYRGPLLLHAAKAMTRREYAEARRFMVEQVGLDECDMPDGTTPVFPDPLLVPRGGIVGTCRLVDVVHTSGLRLVDNRACQGAIHKHRLYDDPWRIPGQFGWVLADVKPVPFVKCRGSLGLWTPPRDVLEQLGVSASTLRRWRVQLPELGACVDMVRRLREAGRTDRDVQRRVADRVAVRLPNGTRLAASGPDSWTLAAPEDRTGWSEDEAIRLAEARLGPLEVGSWVEVGGELCVGVRTERRG